MEQLITFLKVFIELTEKIFIIPDKLISALNLTEWIEDAIIDTVHMLPFLFLVFVAVELIEHKYADKIKNVFGYSIIWGPVLGTVAAIFPQCGFSVIAAGLYIKRIISRGTLIAVFIATSDEAIPILLSNPKDYKLILPIIGVKIVIGIIAGYLTDLIFYRKIRIRFKKTEIPEDDKDIGCCKHDITHGLNKDIFIHPVVHTLHTGLFILIISLLLNYLFEFTDFETAIKGVHNAYLMPVFTSLFGIIPNCSVSIGITILYLKEIITFPAMISGLCSSAGLGLLVLLRRNRFKDTLLVIAILIAISIVCGLSLSLIC